MASSAAYQIGQTWREAQDTNALVRRAQSGDADAIETLLRRSAPILGRAMRSLHLPGEEPADTLAFHRRSFLIALRDYRPERGASWPRFLHMVLVRKVVTVLRDASGPTGQLRAATSPFDMESDAEWEPADPEASADSGLLRAEGEARAWTALRLMRQECTRLEFWSWWRTRVLGQTFGATADALGVSWRTVDNAVRRAVGKAAALGLREYLTGGMGENSD
jgi:DNA-directed RNA polymerase specialized sigma24 family protein